jgi:hypothetical protein
MLAAEESRDVEETKAVRLWRCFNALRDASNRVML